MQYFTYLVDQTLQECWEQPKKLITIYNDHKMLSMKYPLIWMLSTPMILMDQSALKMFRTNEEFAGLHVCLSWDNVQIKNEDSM